MIFPHVPLISGAFVGDFPSSSVRPSVGALVLPRRILRLATGQFSSCEIQVVGAPGIPWHPMASPPDETRRFFVISTNSKSDHAIWVFLITGGWDYMDYTIFMIHK